MNKAPVGSEAEYRARRRQTVVVNSVLLGACAIAAGGLTVIALALQP
ncbi:hypothetical protein [Herbiconiux ginsengi]|uniref:Uncharacterized protein n=1 Tax=Herbiconiux ginsengi TaxID=381665 RepID=A0A1H3SPH6_9MICO|nr:hypothetical protein [Herbiconiux ginsengi]SDZ39627.1 hypothetical protein SAMN05216554_3536 [Herbiconiux ginsengi]